MVSTVKSSPDLLVVELEEGPFTASLTKDKEIAVVGLAGHVDNARDADECDPSRALDRLLRFLKDSNPKVVVFDATHLRAIESTGIVCLKECFKIFSARCIVLGGDDVLSGVFNQLGVLYERKPTLAAALMSLSASPDEKPDTGKAPMFGAKFPFLHYGKLTLGPSFAAALTAFFSLFAGSEGVKKLGIGLTGAAAMLLVQWLWRSFR
ncbi:MAG TPA: hypothetical protein VKY85_17155 [Candidatus Angelobacter sp.]|nr:hypothetical protein [Candidatus Angelobacter sp.]